MYLNLFMAESPKGVVYNNCKNLSSGNNNIIITAQMLIFIKNSYFSAVLGREDNFTIIIS